MPGLIGRKIGMTSVFSADGKNVPCTVIEAGPCVVTQVKTVDTDGYNALQLAFGEAKEKNTTMPMMGIFKKAGTTPKSHLAEFKFDEEHNLGDTITVDIFNDVEFVDVVGTSKGKGFQGVMKRWGFHGGRATHGSKFHREPGGTGNCTTPGHCFKNTKLPGRMGFRRVTVQNLKIVKIDPELNVILVRGAVPGNKDCTLIVKSAVKK